MIPIRTLQRRNSSVSESSCSMFDWVDDDGYPSFFSVRSDTREFRTYRCSLAPLRFEARQATMPA